MLLNDFLYESFYREVNVHLSKYEYKIQPYDAISSIKHRGLIKQKEQFFIQEVNQNIIFYS